MKIATEEHKRRAKAIIAKGKDRHAVGHTDGNIDRHENRKPSFHCERGARG
jgi:hypothetical protein